MSEECEKCQQISRRIKAMAPNAHLCDLIAVLYYTQIFETREEKKCILLCSWAQSKDLCTLWNKMSQNGNCSWADADDEGEGEGVVKVVTVIPDDDDDNDGNDDYYVVINAPLANSKWHTVLQTDVEKQKRTILFQMEPLMESRVDLWGPFWADPRKHNAQFMYFGCHASVYNNLEWHLSKTCTELRNGAAEKDETKSDVLSIIFSDKFIDIGHVKRVMFAQYIQKRGGIKTCVYGTCSKLEKNGGRELPYHQKDDAVFPYKYSFQCENQFVYNYVTEKLVDNILGETLTFYCGCPNIRELIDHRAYIQLDLENFEVDYDKICTAMKNDEWQKRLPAIKQEKQRILNDLGFFPRLHKILFTNSRKQT